MKLGTLFGTRTLEEIEAAESEAHRRRVREARLKSARGNARWTEIDESALVARYGGRVLVHADSDATYKRYRGIVFARSSAALVMSEVALAFSVSPDGELTFYEKTPGTWTEHLEAQAARKLLRQQPSKMRRQT